MRLFGTKAKEPAVTTMLRHLECDRFGEAARALESIRRRPPLPAPASLWRLGRRCAKSKMLRPAKHALELFLELYPNHEDRDIVRADLVMVLRALGRTKEADALVAV